MPAGTDRPGEPVAAEGPAPLVSVRDLRRYYTLRRSPLQRLFSRSGNPVIKAVDGVNLDIWPGETLGLVGESGCGKSTLGRAVLWLDPPTAGSLAFDGQTLEGRSRGDMKVFRRSAQIVFQNPYASLNPRKTVRDILGTALLLRGIRSYADRQREVDALLERVGLNPRHAGQYPHQFSGGQRQRIGIARALAVQPRFIVADEPVSSLDVSVQAQIINLLQDLQRQLHLTYLFVAHDLSVIYHVSHRVAVMYLGQVVETAPTDALFEEPLHPYTQALMSAIPVVDRRNRRERIILEGAPPSPADPPGGCRFHTRCFAVLGDICRRVEPELRQLAPGHFVACHLYNDLPDHGAAGETPA